MRRAAVLEAVDVVLQAVAGRVDGRVHPPHALAEEVVVVHTLGAGHDLLATHEHVVRVGKLGVAGGRHGVEGTDGERELIEDVEVRAVLFENKLA